MTVWLLIPLTLLIPILPWAAALPKWVNDHFNHRSLLLLFSGGLLLDLWWGKPLGLTSFILLTLSVAARTLFPKWAFDGRVFWVILLVVSLVVLELELVFL